MPKLTQQQIQFIFNYLENSGVEYLDARVEMTDHVASALEAMEGDFYENFKAYMLQNKKDLLAQYGRFKKTALNKGLTVLKNNVFSVWFIASVVVLYLLRYPAANYFDEETIIDAYKVISLVPAFTLGLYLGYMRIFNPHTFSVLDQVFRFFILLNIFDPRFILKGLVPVAIYFSFLTVYSFASLISFLKIYKHYNRRYVQNLKLS